MVISSLVSLLVEHARRVHGTAETLPARKLFELAADLLHSSPSVPQSFREAALAELYRQLLAS